MPGMLDTVVNAWKSVDIRKKILFTLAMLVVYSIGKVIPVPGIDQAQFTELLKQLGQLGQLMDIISGGALNQVSLFAMGITPYINSSIILQLLTVAIPALERLQKEGEEGRKKITRITRYVTIGLALFQATAFWYATRSAMSSTLPGFFAAILIIVSFTAGTAFIMWIGEKIDQFGVGNGISLLIFAGIVSRGPQMVTGFIVALKDWSYSIGKAAASSVAGVLATIPLGLLVLAFAVGIVALVVFVSTAERRIPVQYAKRVVGRKQYGGQNTYLPIKVNSAGVLPVIFAMSLLSMPSTIVSFFFANSTGKVATFFKDFANQPIYYVAYALLIVGFTFFYSMIQFNPVEIANNLQKNGGFIPGIRPGRPSSDFILRTSRRLNWFDALFLIIIVLTPVLLGALTKSSSSLWFGGTAILIVVGVSLDLIKQLESQMLMRHYKGFLD
ncbi:MAG: preprotein translocase subunit SecY [Clostridia bacterium]|nr:preprotein translocase subunit SecY [Clostridia bacterium]